VPSTCRCSLTSPRRRAAHARKRWSRERWRRNARMYSVKKPSLLNPFLDKIFAVSWMIRVHENDLHCHVSLPRALRRLWPTLLLPFVDETTVNTLLPDSSFVLYSLFTPIATICRPIFYLYSNEYTLVLYICCFIWNSFLSSSQSLSTFRAARRLLVSLLCSPIYIHIALVFWYLVICASFTFPGWLQGWRGQLSRCSLLGPE